MDYELRNQILNILEGDGYSGGGYPKRCPKGYQRACEAPKPRRKAPVRKAPVRKAPVRQRLVRRAQPVRQNDRRGAHMRGRTLSPQQKAKMAQGRMRRSAERQSLLDQGYTKAEARAMLNKKGGNFFDDVMHGIETVGKTALPFLPFLL